MRHKQVIVDNVVYTHLKEKVIEDELLLKRYSNTIHRMNGKLRDLLDENRQLRCRIGFPNGILPSEACLQDRISALLKANAAQAKRIKELEKYSENIKSTKWDIKPTKKECSDILRQFKIYLECEEY